VHWLDDAEPAMAAALRQLAPLADEHTRGIRAFSGAVALNGSWVYNSSK